MIISAVIIIIIVVNKCYSITVYINYVVHKKVLKIIIIINFKINIIINN